MSDRARLLVIALLAAGLAWRGVARAQEQSAPAQPAEEPPAVPKGVEVQARGPVHEAFATPTSEPAPTPPVAKQPPKPLEELPPEQKPDGDVVWIGGYWAYDDDRKDFLWVSGIWRSVPPGKRWVAGYWRPDGSQWQWVPGFWTATQETQTESQVTYLPAPPTTPETAPPGNPPTADSFYVPGAWQWVDGRYAWRSGYWARVQPGYVWVPAHYRWTPGGYVYIAGYWDYAIAQRGVLYAPVVVDPVVVGPTFVYTPAYVVSDAIVVDALFVRPCYCHYYFGDYYGPTYRTLGFESYVVYGGRHYDSIYVYSAWEHRYEPSWRSVQIDITLARHSGLAPLPPRTLVQQNTIIRNNVTNVTNINNVTINNNVHQVSNTTVLRPASELGAAKGIRTVKLDPVSRQQAQKQAQVVQQVALQRTIAEKGAPGGGPIRPHATSFAVPQQQPVGPRTNAGGVTRAADHGRTPIATSGNVGGTGGPAGNHGNPGPADRRTGAPQTPAAVTRPGGPMPNGRPGPGQPYQRGPNGMPMSRQPYRPPMQSRPTPYQPQRPQPQKDGPGGGRP